MKITNAMVVIFIASFVIHYFLITPIMVYKISHITNNYNKVYLSIILALFAVLLEIINKDRQYKVFSLSLYAIIILLLVVFIYIYRKQIGINDNEYLKNMIEHHSTSILLNKRILEKTDNYHVTKLAKNIIQHHEDDLKTMKELFKIQKT
jgi:hypothetical protein